MAAREHNLYMAKLAEQAERYEEMVQFMRTVVTSSAADELTIEERNLLSVAYKNVYGARKASWRIISSIQHKEETLGNHGHVSIVRHYRSKIESELSSICDGIIQLIDSKLIGSASTADSKVFYLKMKADYYRYLAEFKSGSEKQEAIENTLTAYKAAQDIANEELSPTDPIRLAINLSINPEAPHDDSMVESPSPLNTTFRKKKRKAEAPSTGKRQPWTIVDNELLTKGYLHVSSNCIVENNQKSSNFWKRVLEYYNEGKSSGAMRTAHNLRSHWHMIKKNVNSFNNIMTLLRAQKTTGWSEDQLKTRAHKLYHEQHKTNFIHEHVWNLVKDDPNWRKQSDMQESKGIQTALVEYTTSSDVNTNNADVDNINIPLLVEDCEVEELPADVDNISIPLSVEDCEVKELPADVDNINISLSVEDCEVEELPRPFGTKKAKAKRPSQGKGVEVVTTAPIVNRVHTKVDMVESFNVDMAQMLALKEKKLALQMHQTAMNEMEILYKDTSQMDSETLEFHKERCAIIREKYGKKKQISPSVIL